MKTKNIIILIVITILIAIISILAAKNQNYKKMLEHKTVVIDNEEIEMEACPYCGNMPEVESRMSEYSDSGMKYTIQCDKWMDTNYSHEFRFESETSMKDVIECWNEFAKSLKVSE